MPHLAKRLIRISLVLICILCFFGLLGLLVGSSQSSVWDAINALASPDSNAILNSIIWKIRFPRVIMAALVGSVLSLGGLVFQALLRNPLAEPYILGISGGAAIGAILGILMNLARFPGVFSTAFLGSMTTLGLVVFMASGRSSLKKDALLLSGVMINAFCSAGIMFLVSLTQDSRLHNILFWLMGDLSMVSVKQAGILMLIVIPCFIFILRLSNIMNLMMMGRDMAHTMGVNTTYVIFSLLICTSLMVSSTVACCGLLGFVGLVMPHLLRLIFGPDHRILGPACILGGAAYMIFCDLLARVLPEQGEMPTGVITAMIGAPIFIFLLKRSKS